LVEPVKPPNSSRSVRNYRDILAVIALLVVLIAAVLTPAGNPARILLALIALVFLPGYALTLALFPERRHRRRVEAASLLDPTGSVTGRAETLRAGLTDGERVALSFGLSLATIPIYGLLIEVVWGEYTLVSLLATLTATVGALLAVGASRRRRVESTAEVPFDGIGPSRGVRWIVGPNPRDAGIDALSSLGLAERRSQVTSIALGIAVVVSVVTFGFALATPLDGNQYTEAYLLTDQGDELAAVNYPRAAGDEPAELVLVLENHEGRQVDYTTVVTLERISPDGNTQPIRTLDQFETTLSADDKWQHPHTLALDESGADLRVAYLVYRGDPPATPTRATAYRNLTLWLEPEGV
jgi:uncharacterized membrane protein